MNENEHHSTTPEHHPARDDDRPDWRRLEVAQGRFGHMITEGITAALSDQTEIDDDTARCIAHVLGRAYGRESALAGFGRTGKAPYLTLRDEYLDLYSDERAPASVKELIDWLGTYLVHRENTGTGRRFVNEHLPPKLTQLLVRTSIGVGGEQVTVNIPASWDSGDVDGLAETLGELEATEDAALLAFLALPDVSAGADNIIGDFHGAFAGTFGTEEEALRALSPLEDWETSLADWCIDQGIDFDVLEWNYEPLMERLRDIYDLVEADGRIHAFIK